MLVAVKMMEILMFARASPSFLALCLGFTFTCIYTASWDSTHNNVKERKIH